MIIHHSLQPVITSAGSSYHVALYVCSAQRLLQAKVDRFAKQLEEQHSSISNCSEDLKQQHAEQLQGLHMQLQKQQQFQASSQFFLYDCISEQCQYQPDKTVLKENVKCQHSMHQRRVAVRLTFMLCTIRQLNKSNGRKRDMALS